MVRTKQNLLDILDGRSIVIWGARMTGMGFLRFLKNHNLTISCFVDSDPAFNSKKVNSYPVYHPSILRKMKRETQNLLVVVAVSIKEDEIIKIMQDMDFGDKDFILYSDYCQSFYTIDIVGTCNLQCPSCAQSLTSPKPTSGRMSFGDFKKVIDKVIRENELVTHVSLYSWGEPFLHPQLPAIIEHLHGLGIATAISSNLSIKSVDQIKKVIRAEPEYLKVSLSGYYPDAYNKTHVGGDINIVKSNLYRIKHYIDKYVAGTFVDVNYHLYRNNNGKNLRKMQELCDELGFSLSATYSLVMPLERCLDHCNGIKDPHTDALQDLLLVTIHEGLEVTKDFCLETCPFKDNQTNINWDLSVPVCCTTFSKTGTVVAKNYLEMSIDEIERKKNQADICTQCMKLGLPAYNMGFNQEGWQQVAAKKKCTDK